MHPTLRSARYARAARARRGFTLIEIMVVVIVLGVLAAIVIPNIIGRTDDSRVAKANSDLASFSTLLEQFRLDMRRYPTEEEGLQALRVKPDSEDGELWKGPYSVKDLPKDPWNHDYKYYSPCPNEIDEYGIECLGADGQPGGTGYNADIRSWKEEGEDQETSTQ